MGVLGGVGGTAQGQGTGLVERAVGVTVVASRPAQWLGGYAQRRQVGGRTRLGITLAAGAADGRLAGRAEASLHLLAAPGLVRGLGWYAGAGVALAAGEAAGTRMLLVVGVDRNPGQAHGWYVEAGLAGGVRVAAGWRWRARRRRAGRKRNEPPVSDQAARVSQEAADQTVSAGTVSACGARCTTGRQYRSPSTRTSASCSSVRSL